MGNNNRIQVIQSAKDTEDRLSQKADLFLDQDNPEYLSDLPIVEVHPELKFQEFFGFGGAFTEAAAYVYAHMEPEKQEEIVNAYFHPEQGIGYVWGRTHMNSCDFSLGNYSCDDIAGDVELKYFNIERDQRFIIPMIKAAMRVKGGPINLFISPWSPPGWMKTNMQMNQGGKLKEEYKKTWALFYAKFIKAYEEEGIPIWGLTVQNEPDATQTWDSCRYTAEEERDFIGEYLGPTLAREGLSTRKIIAWDHNRDLLYERAKVLLSSENAAKYIWGMGFHWYSGDQFENLTKTHKAFPNKHLIFTEGCLENGVKLGQWDRGELYAHNIIGDLTHWTNAWVDWNLLLDTNGGPNHVANFCDAPIIADPVTNEVHYQSSYYYIGHFSKYISPGAIRVGCASTENQLEAVAFQNPNGRIITVILNTTDQENSFKFRINKKSVGITSLPHSILTLVFG